MRACVRELFALSAAAAAAGVGAASATSPAVADGSGPVVAVVHQGDPPVKNGKMHNPRKYGMVT